MQSLPVITRVRAWVFRVPIAQPVTTSFGQLKDRPAVFVRLDASDGAWGWGEVFCNFPQVGAEHRARLLEGLLAPLVLGQPCHEAPALWQQLHTQLHRVALQCGEPGPFAQTAGAIDQAVWDMNARRAGLPLWQFAAPEGQTGQPRVQVYASGLGPNAVGQTALAQQAQGYRAFKFKVGFAPEVDIANFQEIRDALGPSATIMVDANQAWSMQEAPQRMAALAALAPLWIEEPVAADTPHADWQQLSQALQPWAGTALAAGENLRGHAQFEAALAAGYLRYIQPDVAKWGGITGCRDVALMAARYNATFCPHWLGGGIGLAASLHLRAAMGLAGYAEVDANPNPLRELIFAPPVIDGCVTLSSAPGLGFEPDLAALQAFERLHIDVTR